jgi:mono/diheme cytochrome c family protein
MRGNHFIRKTGIIIGMSVLVTACTDMYNQPKYKPLRESKSFATGSSRPLVEGTVARGYARTDELLYTGKIGGQLADVFPQKISPAILRRGQDRFNTFCSPCHGRLGDGLGMIVQRGFPRPNSFHADSVRSKPAGFYFDVITNGFGRMYSYAPSVPVEDRWAIIAYVRALQLSQHTSPADLTEQERANIQKGGR